MRKITMIIVLLLGLMQTTYAQVTITVKGKVTDDSNQPVPGATIMEKGTQNGVSTSLDGTFSITVNKGATLECSCIGMKTQEKPSGDGGSINFHLSNDSIFLNEVVAIGYGTVRKEEITSSISRVGEKDFLQGNVSNALQLLQGKVAGLGISHTSGSPTGDISIMLRGISTLAASSSPLIVVDGIAGGSLNAIAPEDIESIDILKDGSAAAIYGTRGTNGVIIINTKSSKEGKTTLEYKTYMTLDKIIDETGDYPTASELRTYKTAFSKVDHRFDQINDFGGNTNWVDEITRVPISQTHYLSAQGGTSLTNYLISTTYNDREGIFRGSFDKSLATKIAINHSMLDDRLKLAFNLSNRFNKQGFVPGDLYYQALKRNPTIPIYNEDGSYYENSNGANPVELLNESTTENKYDQLMMSGKISIEPIKNLILSATGMYMGDFNFYDNSTTYKHYTSTMGSTKGQATISNGHGDDRTLELQGDYTIKEGKHTLQLTGGYSYNQYQHQSSSMYAYDFPVDGFGAWNIGSAQSTLDGTSTLSSRKYSTRLIGFYGRLNYNYGNKYLFMASLRREGSDKFGKNNRWGNFPALSAGWRIKQEPFMKDVEWLSDLKLRLGYGITGTAPSSAYQYVSLYNFNTSYMAYDNGVWVNGIIPSNNANDDLKWERKKELNIGVDYAFFDSRISGSIDLYKRRTDDLLYTYNVPTPPNITNSTLANVGSMENKGIEVSLNATILKKRDLTLSASTNFSYNQNKLISLSNDRYTMEYLTLGYTGQPMQTYTHRLEDGWAVGNFYGWKVKGLKNDTTWDIVGAENSDPSEDNKTIIGNGMPKMFAGLQLNCTWKQFDASVSFRGAFDFQILNSYRMTFETLSCIASANVPKKAYEKIGDYYNFTSPIYSSRYVEDGDYVKLDNVSLGYTLDLRHLGNIMKSARIFMTGMNLLTITKYSGIDPEVNITGLTPGIDPVNKYPNIRSYIFGIDLNF
jgi:TonB-linked SusC/RagA family outer membrane protein